jgi:hypothetical protein
MKFKQFLNEEPLNPEHQKEYKALGKQVNYRDRYNDMFGEKNDRIYIKIPGSVNVEPSEDLEEELEEEAEKILTTLNRKYDDFDFDFELDKKNKRFIFRGEGYSHVTDKPLKDKVITMTFDDIIKKEIKGKRQTLFLNMLKYSAKEGKHNDLSIVISRNPCDIAGMSTNRGWKSCMNLYTGMYNRYVKQDIIHGSLVVYLIDSDDKEIVRPLGRRLIKPVSKGTGKDKDIALRLTDPDYGTNFPQSAINAVKKWLDEKQKGKTGRYNVNKKLYDDEGEETFWISKTVKFKVGDKVRLNEYGKTQYQNLDIINSIGTLIKIDRKYLGVKYEGFKSGNDIHGMLKGKESSSGIWLENKFVEKVK